MLAGDANLIQECLSIRYVAGLTRRQQKAQRHAVGIADHVDLGGQATSAASQRMVYRFFWPPFFPAPEEARVARTAVESIIQVSRSISPS